MPTHIRDTRETSRPGLSCHFAVNNRTIHNGRARPGDRVPKSRRRNGELKCVVAG
jgi:hypothetical protein